MCSGRASSMVALGAAALALVAAGCGTAPAASPPHHVTATAPVRPPVARTAAAEGGRRHAWVTQATIRLHGPVGSLNTLAVGPDAIYALVEHPSPVKPILGYPATITRIVLGKALLTSRPITGAAAGLVRWLPLGSRHHLSPTPREPRSRHAHQLDPSTLKLRRSVALPAPALTPPDFPGAIAAVPGGTLWVGVGAELYRLDSTTAAVTAAFAQPGSLTGLSVSPDSALVYTAGRMAGGNGLIVTERDATSGVRLASHSFAFAVAGGQVSASTAGVWVSYGTGMLGSAVELRSSDLAEMVPPNGATPTLATPFAAAMGFATSISGGVLWLYGTQDLSCANPVTGHVRATEPVNTGVEGPVVAFRGALYVATSNGLAVVAPPSACRVGG